MKTRREQLLDAIQAASFKCHSTVITSPHFEGFLAGELAGLRKAAELMGLDRYEINRVETKGAYEAQLKKEKREA